MVSEDREATNGAGAPLGETNKHQQSVANTGRACNEETPIKTCKPIPDGLDADPGPHHGEPPGSEE